MRERRCEAGDVLAARREEGIDFESRIIKLSATTYLVHAFFWKTAAGRIPTQAAARVLKLSVQVANVNAACVKTTRKLVS